MKFINEHQMVAKIEKAERDLAKAIASAIKKARKQNPYDALGSLGKIKGILFDAEFSVTELKKSIR